MGSKKIYQSKTIQLNTFAPIFSFVLSSLELDVPAEVQISILAVINWGLRFFTNGPIGK